MPKSKTEINPVSIERVKQVINESGMTQKDFAKKVLFYEQQTLSKIVNGKAPLTRESAARIAQYFEDINAAWLMGESDCKTLSEQKDYDYMVEDIQARNQEMKDWHDTLQSISSLEAKIKAFELYAVAAGYLLDDLIDEEDEFGLVGNYHFKFLIDIGRRESVRVPLLIAEEAQIAQEIADFAEFKIKKLIEGSKADG